MCTKLPLVFFSIYFHVMFLDIFLIFLGQMKGEMRGWKPFIEPNKFQQSFKSWKDLLQDSSIMYKEGTMDPYDRLVWDIWMPNVRTTIT